MTYAKSGPFVTGGAPGIQAAFLNNLETWITSVDSSTAIPLVGGVSGTATGYQFLNGILKAFFIDEENFKTGGSTQDIVLTTPFISGCLFWVTSSVNFTFRNAGSTSNGDILTSLSTGASAGSSSSQPLMPSWSQGAYSHPIDTIRFAASANSAHTGYILLLGI